MAQRKHILRGLRFRLTAIYTGLFTLVLFVVSLAYSHNLASTLETQAHDDLNQSWAVVKGNLRIYLDPVDHAEWFFDKGDPEENSTGARIQRVSFIADERGRVLQETQAYQALGSDTLEHIRSVLKGTGAVWLQKNDPHGVPFLIRQSYVYDYTTHTRKYFVGIGRSLGEDRATLDRFRWQSLWLLPLVILTGGITGWFFAGRALMPVLGIARAAQRISGSNLSMRIPSRNAGDELDILIETFNQMIERLEANFNQVRQFSTDVSHELRTPITIIRGQLEVALFTANTAEQYRDAIVNSLSDIERLSQIVRALLLLSQAETGQVILQKQPLDLAEMARGVVDQFQIPAEGAGIELRFEERVARCEGEFDRIQIERMLSNLLSNSIKFTPAGGSVTVSLDQTGRTAELTVSDTGEGISPEHLPHIFDRFYRVRGPSEHSSPEKGLGLGLSFVAWIVRAHGGQVDVSSTLGKGTAFRILLPLGDSPVPPPAPTPAAESMKTV